MSNLLNLRYALRGKEETYSKQPNNERHWQYGYFAGENENVSYLRVEQSKIPVVSCTLGSFTGIYDASLYEEINIRQKQACEDLNLSKNKWKGMPVFEDDFIQYTDGNRRRIGIVKWREPHGCYVVVDSDDKNLIIKLPNLIDSDRRIIVVGNQFDGLFNVARTSESSENWQRSAYVPLSDTGRKLLAGFADCSDF